MRGRRLFSNPVTYKVLCIKGRRSGRLVCQLGDNHCMVNIPGQTTILSVVFLCELRLGIGNGVVDTCDINDVNWFN